ncbi:MAG: fibronectin type III domain-containing protein, partial [Actinobacteria bacterium]|nr:fibronectin type III domain-containing protein [Actinomycetota bacterium]
ASGSVTYGTLATLGGRSLTLSKDTCSGTSRTAGQTCVVDVDFAPTTEGDLAATLRAPYTAAGTSRTLDVPITGTAVPASTSSAGDTTAQHSTSDYRTVSGTNGAAQRFTAAAAGVVSEASAWLSYSGTGTPLVTAELRAAEPGPGAVLATTTLPPSAVGTGTGVNVRFVFPNPPTVAAGQRFYLALTASGADGLNNEYRWWSTTASSAESWYVGSGSSWSQVTNGLLPRAGSATVLTPATAPSAPGGVTATRRDGAADVSWTPATDNGSAVTGYTVTASPGGATKRVTGLGALVDGLTNGTAYTFTVTATNAVGTGPASVASAAVTPAGVPSAPTAVTATPRDSAAVVSWVASAANGSAVTGYTVTSSPAGHSCSTSGAVLCTLTELTNGTPYTFTVTANNAVGVSAASAPSPSVSPRAAFRSLSPERLLDTRSGLGYVGDKPAAGQTVELQVTGVGVSLLPADASAVVLNVTGVQATANGFVTVWPCGSPRPNAANLNLVATEPARPNLVIAKVGIGGKVCLYTLSGTHLLADLSGYYPAGSDYVPVTPERQLDTRNGTGYTGAKPAPGQTVELQVTGVGTTAVPADASAVVLNVTGVQATTSGFVTVWPCGT